MARAQQKQDGTKEPGRLKQMWLVFQMTRRYEPAIVWYLLLAFLLPLGAGISLAVWLSRDNWLGIVLYVLAGLLGGLLAALIVLGRRAERAAFAQIEGQPGAVGAVLSSSLRRSWTASEMPVNLNKMQDAVYRAVGKGGVVLIGEGPRSRVQPMLDKERANVRRVVPEVPVHYVYVGPDPDSTPLHRIVPTLAKFKRVLTRAEVLAVANRLSSLGKAGALPIPKGIDPMRVRMPRPR